MKAKEKMKVPTPNEPVLFTAIAFGVALIIAFAVAFANGATSPFVYLVVTLILLVFAGIVAAAGISAKKMLEKKHDVRS